MKHISDVMLSVFEQRAEIAIKQNEGDYIGEDGLLYCGKCNTKKQTNIIMLGIPRQPMCLCKCESERKNREYKAEQRIKFERRIKEMRKSGFPETDMEEWTFANDDRSDERISNAMRAYCDNFGELKESGKGLLLYGNVGTGKTFYAACIANELISKGYPVLMTNFSRIVNKIQGMYEGKQDYLDSLNQFALIVIDDLGAERTSEFMTEQIYNIINNRYRANLPMIVTTNLSIDEVKRKDNVEYMRIYDRILERCHPVEISGASRRRQKVKDGYSEFQKMLGL